MKTGTVVTLDVESLAFGGAGVAHVEGFVVFVKGGLPGQQLVGRITKKKRGWAEARVLEVVRHGPNEVTPACRHFGQCGGCVWQGLDYAAQAAAKGAQVRDCLERIGGLPDPPLEPTVTAPNPYRYRNKMEFSFSPQVWRVADEVPDRFGLGLHVRGFYDKIINITECHLVPEWVAAVVVAARAAAEATGLPAWNTHDQSGFFRFLVVREGVQTGERMVSLITSPAAPDSPEEQGVTAVIDAVAAAVPGITAFVHGVTDSRAGVAFSQAHRALGGGPDRIRERLLDNLFEIGPNTFFQTNTLQAERLFEIALELAGPRVDQVLDLYCGVGALTLPLARRHGNVLGIELIEASVEAARVNAALNGVENVQFRAADVRRALPEIPRPELLVVDPPREGLHADVAAGIVTLAPPRIVHVSCNPATLARDLQILVAGGYRLRRVIPVDMFPQTGHIEVVALLERAGAGDRDGSGD